MPRGNNLSNYVIMLDYWGDNIVIYYKYKVQMYSSSRKMKYVIYSNTVITTII